MPDQRTPRQRRASHVKYATAVPHIRVKVDAWDCTCLKCGHRWLSLAVAVPRVCAGCKQIGWNIEGDGRSKTSRRKQARAPRR